MGELVGAQLQQGIGESPQDSLAIVSAAAVDYGIIKKKPRRAGPLTSREGPLPWWRARVALMVMIRGVHDELDVNVAEAGVVGIACLMHHELRRRWPTRRE